VGVTEKKRIVRKDRKKVQGGGGGGGGWGENPAKAGNTHPHLYDARGQQPVPRKKRNEIERKKDLCSKGHLEKKVLPGKIQKA